MPRFLRSTRSVALLAVFSGLLAASSTSVAGASPPGPPPSTQAHVWDGHSNWPIATTTTSGVMGVVRNGIPLSGPNAASIVVPSGLGPIVGAVVSIPALHKSTTTDASGRFVLSGIPTSALHPRYNVVVSAPGFGKWTLLATIVRPRTFTYLDPILTTAPQSSTDVSLAKLHAQVVQSHLQHQVGTSIPPSVQSGYSTSSTGSSSPAIANYGGCATPTSQQYSQSLAPRATSKSEEVLRGLG